MLKIFPRTLPLAFAISLCWLSAGLVILLILPLPAQAGKKGKAPQEIGGFVLGSAIGDYADVTESNFLKEIVVTNRYGFRKGIVSYGVCKYTDQILKIELKYENSTKEFFNELLKKFKDSYGPPDEWKGDSFGIHHVWKWRFIDERNREISLLLQHNLQDPSENTGNMVKMSYPHLLEEEQECFNQMCDEVKDDQEKQRREKIKEADWHFMIPR